MAGELVEVYCGFCGAFHDEFPKKSLPKSFVCEQCQVGQVPVATPCITYSHKRNYPEGYFEN